MLFHLIFGQPINDTSWIRPWKFFLKNLSPTNCCISSFFFLAKIISVMFSTKMSSWKAHSKCLKLYGGLVAKSCLTLGTSWTVALQAPLSMGSSRQEYWSGLPFPSPGDLPDPWIEPRSPALHADSLLTELWGKLR